MYTGSLIKMNLLSHIGLSFVKELYPCENIIDFILTLFCLLDLKLAKIGMSYLVEMHSIPCSDPRGMEYLLQRDSE